MRFALRLVLFIGFLNTLLLASVADMADATVLHIPPSVHDTHTADARSAFIVVTATVPIVYQDPSLLPNTRQLLDTPAAALNRLYVIE